MISLQPNEQVHMLIRRHWYALFRRVALLPALLFVLVIFFAVAAVYPETIYRPEVRPFVHFTAVLYLAGLLLYAFVMWVDYYLDVWIITDKRLIDIEQRGLFNRKISELPMTKIQNVTMEISGIIQTMLRFGNLRVETASQSTFVIHDAPDMYKAKELILKYARQSSTNNRQPDAEILNPKP